MASGAACSTLDVLAAAADVTLAPPPASSSQTPSRASFSAANQHRCVIHTTLQRKNNHFRARDVPAPHVLRSRVGGEECV